MADLPRTADRFVPVPLPAGPEIVSVAGWSEQDLWLLNRANDVYRYDGRAARLVHPALCLTERPREFPNPFVEPMCRIAPLRDGVLAIGAQGGSNEIWAVRARLGPGERTDCVSEPIEPRVLAQSPTTAWLVATTQFCQVRWIQVLAGPRVPSPALQQACGGSEQRSTPITHLWMSLPQDVWAAGPRVWHYQGIGWQDRGAAPFEVIDLWANGRGSAWLLGKLGSEPPKPPVYGPSMLEEIEHDHPVGEAPEAAVARFDGARWRPVPVPEGFSAARVHGTAPDDVWFVGGPRAYQLDGRSLRQAAMPLDGVWDIHAVGDELWVVGYVQEPWRRAAPSDRQVVNEGDRRGAAVRLSRAAKEGGA